MTKSKVKGVMPEFSYGLCLRVNWCNGDINKEKYEVSTSGACVMIDFPDRRQMISFKVTDMVQEAYKMALEHPEEVWDKEREKTDGNKDKDRSGS